MSASSQPECIFCRIAAGEAPCFKVLENDHVLAFMDIRPAARGHTLVVPKAHCDDLFDADPEDLRAVIACSQRVAHAIRRALRPDGLGVHQLCGAAAGQTVFHYHMHLIPRSHGEPMRLHGRQPGDPARLAELAEKLRAAL